jgi:hypothetical protein
MLFVIVVISKTRFQEYVTFISIHIHIIFGGNVGGSMWAPEGVDERDVPLLYAITAEPLSSWQGGQRWVDALEVAVPLTPGREKKNKEQ